MRPRRHLRLIMMVAMAACSAPAREPVTPTPTDAATSSEAASPSASLAPSSSTPPVSGDFPSIALEIVADGLVDPINVTGTPEGWLLINERAGRVVAVSPAGGESAIALDISDRVQGDGEQGLLGFALHPEWPAVRRAFVHYSDRATDGDTVISEVSGTPGTADAPPSFDAASEQVLLQEDQPFPNHNGGQIAFGDDGYLYVGLGDGGAGGDPLGNGQDPGTVLGAILRLDVATSGTYGVPDDNPFATGENGAPEVFLYGLRNPWRFSFDRDTGLLWVADVGQGAFEEVNRIDPATQSGANLGWNIMEGGHCFADPSCSPEGLTLPLAEYGRDLGCAVTGGYVYRGEVIAGLAGWYLFADFCTGFIFGVPADAEPQEGTVLTPVTLLESGLRVSAFGEGLDGELYVADLAGGALYRVIAGP